YKVDFPTLFAPTLVTMIPISVVAHLDFAWYVAKELQDRGVRVHVDERNEKLQYMIRQSQTSKIPFHRIVGDKEMEVNAVN
ncbi:His/Gly/Thr/Pro-type tRNA ligase C-terminal domain-containing protein, partial [Streptococcus suis]